MKLPFYLRKSKSYIKDNKLWIEIEMNWFDKFCLILFNLKKILC